MNTETQSFSEDLRHYLRMLLQWAWLMIAVTVAAGGTANFLSARMRPVYVASTLVMINEAPSTKSLDYSSVMTSERLARTYAEVMTTSPVLEGVLTRLGLTLPIEDLKESIKVQPVRDTQLIQVHVEDTDASRAARIANALVSEFSEQNLADQVSRYANAKGNLEEQLTQLDRMIQATGNAITALQNVDSAKSERDRLETNLTQYQQRYNTLLASYEQARLTEAQTTATVVQKEPARTKLRPVRPRVLFNTIIASVLGLVLSVGIIFLVEALDDTLRDPEEVGKQLGLPVLGIIAHHSNHDNKPITTDMPRAPVSEAFRMLRTNLQFASINRPLRTLLVTSPLSNDGKSTVAVNLGVVLAQDGKQVVIMDADLRRPNLHKKLNLPNLDGISSLFLQIQSGQEISIDLEARLQPSGVPGLQALTSGRLPPNPAELLGSENMSKILQALGERSEFTVIDTSPVLAVTDAAVLSSRVDGVLLVIKPGTTKLGACKQAVDQLRRVGANVLGVVLSDVAIKRSRYSYYSYQENYTDQPDSGRRNGKSSASKVKASSC